MDPRGMALPAARTLKVRVPENEWVAERLHEKRMSTRDQTDGLKVHLDRTFAKAYQNVCGAPEPVRTLKEFSKINGVGPWLIRQMKEFFPDSNQDVSPAKAKKTRKPKSPKKNPAASGPNQDLSTAKVKKTRKPKSPKKNPAASDPLDSSKEIPTNFGLLDCSLSVSPFSSQGTCELQSSGTMGSAEFNMPDEDTLDLDNSMLAMPPRQSSKEFLEAYEVVFILDDRENFGGHSRKYASGKVAEKIRSLCKVPVEVKRLPIGDGIWIARHRELLKEYVLDFVVERKIVTDLGSSITDNRYKDQKLRLQKCGLRKLMYLVEGDLNSVRSDASERIKTACLTTEIHEGFDVLRTSGYTDTVKTYANLTLSIIEYYSTNFSALARSCRVCPTYAEFEGRCRDLKRKTVSEIFALQLMQVPQVTEQVALAVIELYPTLLSLARAYSMLEGNIRAQEEMLKNKSKMVNAGASRNIFNLVWGEGGNLQT